MDYEKLIKTYEIHYFILIRLMLGPRVIIKLPLI